MKKTVLTFGIMAGVIIIAYTFVTLLILGDFGKMTPKDLAAAEALGYIRYLILLLGVVMAMVTYRKNVAGPISYGRALRVGVLVAVVTALFVGAMELTYVAFINPEFYDQYAKLTASAMQARGASAAEIAETQSQLQSMQWMTSPGMTGLFYFVETAVIGIILSLIAAIFIRRKEGESPAEGGRSMVNQTA